MGDTIEIMKRNCPSHTAVHLHCFSDSLEYAQVMLREFPKLCVGFTGAVTFKNAKRTREALRQLPLDRLLLETDGPYMCPAPYRGRVAHPGYIPLVAEQVAKLHGVRDVNKVLRQCRANARRVYGV